MTARICAHPGQREALAAVMLGSIGTMPGCLSYVVANDSSEADILDHGSLNRQSQPLCVAGACCRAIRHRPLIAALESNVIVEPIGGIGLGGDR